MAALCVLNTRHKLVSARNEVCVTRNTIEICYCPTKTPNWSSDKMKPWKFISPPKIHCGGWSQPRNKRTGGTDPVAPHPTKSTIDLGLPLWAFPILKSILDRCYCHPSFVAMNLKELPKLNQDGADKEGIYTSVRLHSTYFWCGLFSSFLSLICHLLPYLDTQLIFFSYIASRSCHFLLFSAFSCKKWQISYI